MLVGLGLLMGVGCGSDRVGSDWKRLESPIPAKDFTLPSLDGQSVRLADLKGQVVIMEFWATWCGPCRFSTPSLDTIYKQFRDRGVTVLLVNQGEAPEKIRKWAKQRFTAPILLDQDGAVGQQYSVSGIPHLVIIDQAGQILYVHGGYSGGLERNLAAILNDLLTNDQARISG